MKGVILNNIRLNDKYFLMEIDSAEFVKTAKPGHFLMVKAGLQSYISDPLLRRPLGVVDTNGSKFRVLYMVVGKGTRLMTKSPSGAEIEFSAAAGNGFKIRQNEKIALVAGGVGIAPLLWTAKALKENGCSVTLFFGGRSSDDIVLTDEFKPFIDDIIITTNDGTHGEKGFVTIPLERDVKSFDHVYACGPNQMLKALSGVCEKHGVSIDVSLDERMACGMGACLGCLIYIEEGGEIVQKRCCIEGPVFDGRKVAWKKVCG